ncbi:MAG: ferritin-like domain-containing protein [Actinobacteria bacterium]|nr:ferritin-like domain-containing protein [Actinomycetota bacterium]
MELDHFLRDPQSRRRFFRMTGVGVAGASAVLLGACSDDTKNPVRLGPDESDQADVEILNGLLDLEFMAIAAYKAGAPKLGGERLGIVKVFLEQEQAHADGLSGSIEELDGKPNRAKSDYDFPVLRTEADVLRFALDLENTAIAAYIDALPKFSEKKLRSTAASIITNEAEHASVLLDALGREPVPAAFVTGKAA